MFYTTRRMNHLIDTDTIAALASAPGRAGIAVIRISGQRAEEVLRAILVPSGKNRLFESHLMMYGRVADGASVLDECMAVLMRAPRSYTREDVAEIHLHGGEYVVDSVLNLLWAHGVRPAEPGEFTRRAYLSGRVDLSRAEAVMQLIGATGERAARAALRDLQGGASAFIKAAQDELQGILAGVAAALDYPEEVDEAQAVGDLVPRLRALAKRLATASDERSARILEKGLEVVIAGRPNVGKSSLLNLLLGEERAIVTEEAGTTRDIVRGSTLIGGLRINFSDTAGIRDSEQRAEQIGIRRAKEAMAHADVVLMVLDQALPLTPQDEELLGALEGKPHLIVLNKADLVPYPRLPQGLLISSHTGEGVEALREAIASHAGAPDEGGLHLARHMRLARTSAAAMMAAAQAMVSGEQLDLCALHLYEALYALGEVTGENTTEGLLDRVFGDFCVGK